MVITRKEQYLEEMKRILKYKNTHIVLNFDSALKFRKELQLLLKRGLDMI